ncbi:MAG: type IX secretion system protein PorQ [Flavobacteriales bacterium]|jgi:hypothetical protein|nr:type IX secretion system protein PorQ [Flavobacteriales bacterium]MBT6747061.1 type IX secretion system protein PorQ [Flavobacteriales bacterium]
MRVLLIILFPLSLFSQIGGNSTYQFLDVPISARSAAIGGHNISVKNGDMNCVEDNPALIDSSYVNNLSLNYINYIADINYGYVGFTKSIEKLGMINVGMQYFNYGNFIRADYTGQILGDFRAQDYSLNFSFAKQWDSTYSIGGTLKHIFSDYESYESFGLAVDLGGYYHSKSGLFTAGLVLNNMGAQLVGYTPGNRERLPFHVNLGLSQKFRHAPIRLNLVVQHLQKWDLTYGGSLVEEKASFTSTSDKVLRHLIIGAEILPSKNVFINFAYDYHKRQQLKLAARTGLSGISFGVGIKISKFSLSYGRSTYHLGGASNHLTVVTNLGDFKKKAKISNEEN